MTRRKSKKNRRRRREVTEANPNAVENQIDTPSQQKEVTASPASLRKQKAIIARIALANPIFTFASGGILFATFFLYGESKQDEVGSLMTAVLPLLFVVFIIKRVNTNLIGQVGELNEGGTRALRNLVLWRSALTIAWLSISVYPGVVLSEAPERITAFIDVYYSSISEALGVKLREMIAWILSGILGWLGQILLGAFGSALWHIVHARLKKRSN